MTRIAVSSAPESYMYLIVMQYSFTLFAFTNITDVGSDRVPAVVIMVPDRD